MTDSMKQPRDGEGHFVSLRDYVALAIHELEKSMDKTFAASETTAEFKRTSLATALAEAKATTDAALKAAADSVENKLVEAKTAADERGLVLQTRIEKLESGGAPFASRLDDGMRKLREDVDKIETEGTPLAIRVQGIVDGISRDVAKLNTSAVKQEVVDALRVRQDEDLKAQKKQTRVALISGGVALVLAVAETLLRVFN